MAPATTLADEIGIALANLAESATGTLVPTLRLGVTGLSRAGKTVFITALVQVLVANGRLPGFAPVAEGRLLGGALTEYPDRAMPRFAFEQLLS
ncbi:MAG: YcjX family protein, partial [Devosia sp.]